MRLVDLPSSRIVRPIQLSEYDFDFTLTNRPLSVESVTESIKLADALTLRTIAAATDTRFDLVITEINGSRPVEVAVRDGTGEMVGSELRRLSNGPCRVIVGNRLLKKQKTVTHSRTGGAISYALVSYDVGSLAKHFRDFALSKSVGKNATHKPLYTSQYTRNADCWLSGVDISGASISSSGLGVGVAVSPRHVILANHVGGQGTVIHFVSMSGDVYARTIVNAASVVTDIGVGLLDVELPPSIPSFKILPNNFRNYLPTVAELKTVPVFGIDNSRNCLSFELDNISVQGVLNYRVSQDSTLATFSEAIVGGDSGNAVFAAVNGEATLLGCWWTSAPPRAAAPCLSDHIPEINAAMTTLGGGYQLTTVDLSGFTNYG